MSTEIRLVGVGLANRSRSPPTSAPLMSCRMRTIGRYFFVAGSSSDPVAIRAIERRFRHSATPELPPLQLSQQRRSCFRQVSVRFHQFVGGRVHVRSVEAETFAELGFEKQDSSRIRALPVQIPQSSQK
jgi:hypothetical protein